jgi:hypothetical protein
VFANKREALKSARVKNAAARHEYVEFHQRNGILQNVHVILWRGINISRALPALFFALTLPAKALETKTLISHDGELMPKILISS